MKKHKKLFEYTDRYLKLSLLFAVVILFLQSHNFCKTLKFSSEIFGTPLVIALFFVFAER